jgi:hypothetical protein
LFGIGFRRGNIFKQSLGIPDSLKAAPTAPILYKRVALAHRRLSAPRIAQERTMLKVIPITKPGAPGFSYALARTDADEMAVRKNAAAQELLAGKAMSTEPNLQFWSFVDSVKRR